MVTYLLMMITIKKDENGNIYDDMMVVTVMIMMKKMMVKKEVLIEREQYGFVCPPVELRCGITLANIRFALPPPEGL